MTIPNNPEIGKQLTAAELKASTIVVVKPPDFNGFFTLWVREVRDNSVLFSSGVLRQEVINSIRDDGKIVDDQGRVIEVFEYLGEP